MNLLRLKVILAAIDYDDPSVVVLESARRLADAAGATLHVVHVDQSRAVTEVQPGERLATSIDTAVDLLRRAKVQVDGARVHVIAGEPARVIRALADRIRADVIVLGPHREAHGGAQRLGSTALAIATASQAPCLIVTREIHLPLTRVLVPVDLSDTARGALLVALSWSSALRASGASSGSEGNDATCLTAMHVDQPAGAATRSDARPTTLDAELERVRREAGDWAGVTIEGVSAAGDDVAKAIAARTRDDRADLVVLGTRGLGIDDVGRLGSVSASVISLVDVPVLLVPPALWTQTARAPARPS